MAAVGRLLERHRSLRMAEILSVFLVAGAVTVPGWRLVGPNPFARQVVVWVANVLMLLVVWLGLRARGQGWEHFGLRFRFAGWGALGRTVLRSLMVLIAALGAFVVAAIVMRNIQGAAGAAAPGRYNYLQGNLPLLLLALVAVYIVSSFGEEVLYRGFLINRIAELGGRGRFAWTLGAVSSAAIFGLAHFDWGLAGVAQTGFMGLALAAAYLFGHRNLWPLVLAHAYIDTLLLVPMYLGTTPGPG